MRYELLGAGAPRTWLLLLLLRVTLRLGWTNMPFPLAIGALTPSSYTEATPQQSRAVRISQGGVRGTKDTVAPQAGRRPERQGGADILLEVRREAENKKTRNKSAGSHPTPTSPSPEVQNNFYESSSLALTGKVVPRRISSFFVHNDHSSFAHRACLVSCYRILAAAVGAAVAAEKLQQSPSNFQPLSIYYAQRTWLQLPLWGAGARTWLTIRTSDNAV